MFFTFIAFCAALLVSSAVEVSVERFMKSCLFIFIYFFPNYIIIYYFQARNVKHHSHSHSHEDGQTWNCTTYAQCVLDAVGPGEQTAQGDVYFGECHSGYPLRVTQRRCFDRLIRNL
jgi:hypothetical protein